MVSLARGAVVAERYQLIEEIGRGGMGTVWHAHAIALERGVALKMLLPGGGDEARQRARLVREARAVAKLHSPYIVTVYDVGEWEGRAFIAMELLKGMSLRAYLQRRSIPPRDVTLEILRQVALGLDKAHEAQLIHRDLKPDNIFVLDHDPLLTKILDFGIAKRAADVGTTDFQTTTGTISGTPLYMSPEQALGSKTLDYRSDLWSLAVIAYECVVGRPPFLTDTLFQLMLKIVSEPLPVPSRERPELPAAFDRFWARAASREPHRRPDSALALWEGLRTALHDEPGDEPEATSSATAPAEPRPALSTRLGWLGAGAAAVLGMGYVWLGSDAAKPTPIETSAAPARTAESFAPAPIPAQLRATPALPTPHAPDASTPLSQPAQATAVAPASPPLAAQPATPAPPPRTSVRRAPKPARPPASGSRKNAPEEDDPLGF